MEPDASVTRLIQLLRDDDPAVRDMAASLIWQRYFRDLLDLARKNLDKRVRRRADEEDVLQSMFQSFCARQGRGEFDLADRDELWRLLVTITLRKARNAARDHHRDRRDVARERTLSANADEDNSCPVWAFEQMDASGPSPAEAAVLNEALERTARLAGRSRAPPDRPGAPRRLHQPRDRRPARLHRALGRAKTRTDSQQVDVVRRRFVGWVQPTTDLVSTDHLVGFTHPTPSSRSLP